LLEQDKECTIWQCHGVVIWYLRVQDKFCFLMKSLKIPKGKSEAVNRRRIENTLVKRWSTKHYLENYWLCNITKEESLVFFLCFVDRCFSFLLWHCIIYHSSIPSFRLLFGIFTLFLMNYRNGVAEKLPQGTAVEEMFDDVFKCTESASLRCLSVVFRTVCVVILYDFQTSIFSVFCRRGYDV